jgi:hypothetical protein
LIISGREIDADVFRILENIEENGEEWLLWMSDVSGEDETDLSTLGGGESLQDDGKARARLLEVEQSNPPLRRVESLKETIKRKLTPPRLHDRLAFYCI